MSDDTFDLELTREFGYRIRVQSGRAGVPPFHLDEPPPLGAGGGPTPAELLGAAVGGCLTASLLFCLEKSRVPLDGVSTRVEGSVERNERGRLRIGEIRVALDLGLEGEAAQRAQRCLGIFQDFCMVSESVQRGIPVTVDVITERAPGPEVVSGAR